MKENDTKLILEKRFEKLSKHYEELIEVERFVYIVIKDKRFEFHFI